MIHKKLKVLLLSAAFLGLPAVQASDWKAIGASVKPSNNPFDSGSLYVFDDTGTYVGEDRILQLPNTNPETPKSPKFWGRTPRSSLFGAHGRKQSRWHGYDTREAGGGVKAGDNKSFEATSTDSTLNIYGTLNGDPNGIVCPLKIDGDVTLTAHSADMTVNIKSRVEFIPYLDPTSTNVEGTDGKETGNGYSQLVFDTAAGREIVVNMNYDLSFKGITLGAASKNRSPEGKNIVTRDFASNQFSGDLTPLDMFVTFKGPGKVTFVMADGTAIKFLGDIDGTQAVDLLSRTDKDLSLAGVSQNAGGTKVLITMDQTKANADAQQNKVEFKRKNAGASSNATTNNPNALRNMVLVGTNSIMTYVSDDPTGSAYKTLPSSGGFGSVSFDVSNVGAGRMVLFILGAATFGWEEMDANGNPLYTDSDPEFFKLSKVYPFNDGAVVVAGCNVASYDPADIRTTLNFSKPAGGQAVMRVTDQGAYDAWVKTNPNKPYVTSDATTRGLLVVNTAQNIGKLAADRYLDFMNIKAPPADHETGLPKMFKRTSKLRERLASKMQHMFKNRGQKTSGSGSHEVPQINNLGGDWCYAKGLAEDADLHNVRFGYVVGVNGLVDVYDNTFVDYVAGAKNGLDLLALNDYQDYNSANKSRAILMEHNPSAFTVDGLDSGLFVPALNLNLAFQVANPFKAAPISAGMVLRGSARMLARASATSDQGYIERFWQIASPGYIQHPTAPKSLNMKPSAWRAMRAAAGSSEQPKRIDPLAVTDLNWDFVLAVEDSNFNGYNLDMSGAKVGQDGQNAVEIEGAFNVQGAANNSAVDQKTGKARNYATVVAAGNSGIELLSTAVDAKGNVIDARPLSRGSSYTHYNSARYMLNDALQVNGCSLVHSDVTKLVDSLPSSSRPAIVGGERVVFADAILNYDGSDPFRYRFPELRLDNGKLELQESLSLSGLRVVVADLAGLPTKKGDNHSAIQFFDHGDAADTNFSGYGRVLNFGSYHNIMADGSTNWITESAYLNGFKRNAPPASLASGDHASRVSLSLINGDQFPSSVAAANYDKQRAVHLVLFSTMDHGAANAYMGWQSIQGDSSGASFPYGNTLYGNGLLGATPKLSPSALFSLDALKVPAARLVVNGDFIAFSGFDKNGASSRVPVSLLNASGVVYAGHGGAVAAAGAHQTILDTALVVKMWNDYALNSDVRSTRLSGIVDIPQDQITFGPKGAVQPIGLSDMLNAATDTNGFARLSFDNPARQDIDDRSGGGVVTVNWFNTANRETALASESRNFAAKIRNLRNGKLHTRDTASLTGPVSRPSKLLYVGPFDDIQQLRVAGATLANPFMLQVSGNDTDDSYGRVREFASVAATGLPTDHMVGAGQHAVLFGSTGGRFGLGSTGLNADSASAWNRLGREAVQIAAAGDCIVDVNSDLVVVDDLPLVATNSFGHGAVHRVTFYSELAREIRVPAGTELNLSTFGQGDHQQQIAFGGNVKLVLEPGATIRFPQNPKKGVVLYFNDDSQLVFEAGVDRASGNLAFKDSATADLYRTKIVGHGQIWANKQASISVPSGAYVGVRSDDASPTTNVTVSLNRSARFEIGSNVESGGAFEVGNPLRSGATSLAHNVDFKLTTIHGDSVVHIDRGGFLGLGAGVITKVGSMNGSAAAANNPVLVGGVAQQSNGVPVFAPASDAWTVQRLQNVGQVSVALVAGTFEHNSVVDGSSADASLIALGNIGTFSLSVGGANDVTVKGGGNVMLVGTNNGGISAVNCWDYASPLASGDHYGVLASGPMLLDRSKDVAGAARFNAGWSFKVANAAQALDLLTAVNFSDEAVPYVSVGQAGTSARAVNVNLDAGNSKYAVNQRIIVRRPVNALVAGLISDVLNVGAALGVESDALGALSYGVVPGGLAQ